MGVGVDEEQSKALKRDDESRIICCVKREIRKAREKLGMSTRKERLSRGSGQGAARRGRTRRRESEV